MNDDNSFNFLNQVFSRFLISGVVFIVFTILMPSFIWVNLLANISHNQITIPVFITIFTGSILELANKPTLIVLLSISIGILLDLFRFYNSWVWTSVLVKDPKSSKYNLKVAIVDAFGILINEAEQKEEYKNKVIELAFEIHSVFVKTKHPKIDQKISDNRTYPEILSMSLISMILGLMLLGVLILIIIFYNSGNAIVFLYFGCMAILTGITVFFGRIKVQQEYRKITQLIGSLIKKAYDESQAESRGDLDAFFESMQLRGLVEKTTGEHVDFKWQVKIESIPTNISN